MTPLLTVTQAAEQLRVSRRTLYRLVGEGQLRPTRIRGRTLFTEKELAAFVAAASRAA